MRLGETAASHGPRGQALESFSRPLWGLLPLEHGGGGFPDWALYARGLTVREIQAFLAEMYAVEVSPD